MSAHGVPMAKRPRTLHTASSSSLAAESEPMVCLIICDLFGKQAWEHNVLASTDLATVIKDTCAKIRSFLLLKTSGKWGCFSVHSITEVDATIGSLADSRTGKCILAPLMPADMRDGFFDGAPQMCNQRHLFFDDKMAEEAYSHEEHWTLLYGSPDRSSICLSADEIEEAYGNVAGRLGKVLVDERYDPRTDSEVALQAMKDTIPDLQAVHNDIAEAMTWAPESDVEPQDALAITTLGRLNQRCADKMDMIKRAGICAFCVAIVLPEGQYPLTCPCKGKRVFHKWCMYKAIHAKLKGRPCYGRVPCPYCTCELEISPVTPPCIAGDSTPLM